MAQLTPSSHRADSAPVRLDRDGSAFIVAIDGDIEELLGWSAADLIGRPSTEFIHPQDQPSAIHAWMSMIDQPGRPFRWRGRYRNRAGEWTWVETVNTNHLDDPAYGRVLTIMHGVDRGDLSVEEQLRAHEQLLNRLADALPVGIVHFDATGVIIATNGRLDAIVGRSDTVTVEDVFADVVDDDVGALTCAIESTLDGRRGVDDVELRLDHPSGSLVVCSVSMRSLTDLDDAVTGGIATVNDVTDEVRMRDELEHRAMTDPLTGCLNRRAILEQLDDMLQRAAPTDGVAVVFVDLDDFKLINDTLGHAIGDDVLITVAGRLRDVVRSVDQVGRLGGDEFIVICPDVAEPDEASRLARCIANVINVETRHRELSVPIRASIGVAFAEHRTDSNNLVATADAAMYQSKQARDQLPVFVPCFIPSQPVGTG